MEELSIEEKAKRYDEALDKARKLYNSEETSADVEIACENIFPELIESEDERIKKEIIDIVKSQKEQQCHIDGSVYDKMIAWLEKQGKQILANSAKTCKDEQKTTEKAEPKFHEGDWVIDKQGTAHKIAKVVEIVTNHTYGYDIVGGGYFNENIEGVRLWTIEDAKDGDVLAWDDNKCIAIFKDIYDEESFESHGCVGHLTGIFEPKQFYHDIEGAHPATKEQRDTLKKAMADAGWEFDIETKVLNRIEQEPTEKQEPKFKVGNWS